MSKNITLVQEFNVKKREYKHDEDIKDYEVFSDKKKLDALRTKIVQNLINGKIPENVSLEQYINDYKDLLKKQVELLDADVLVCCGYSESVGETGNLILNFLKENVYDLKKFDDWIYVEKEDDKVKRIAINAWHLSYSGVSQRDFYEGLVSSYHNFIQKHPEFVKHR